MIFLDTNILIEYLKGNKSLIEPYLLVKGYNLSHNMKMMDAIIASTVLVYDMKLMSLNRKDFIYLDAIELV